MSAEGSTNSDPWGQPINRPERCVNAVLRWWVALLQEARFSLKCRPWRCLRRLVNSSRQDRANPRPARSNRAPASAQPKTALKLCKMGGAILGHPVSYPSCVLTG